MATRYPSDGRPRYINDTLMVALVVWAERKLVFGLFQFDLLQHRDDCGRDVDWPIAALGLRRLRLYSLASYPSERAIHLYGSSLKI